MFHARKWLIVTLSSRHFKKGGKLNVANLIQFLKYSSQLNLINKTFLHLSEYDPLIQVPAIGRENVNQGVLYCCAGVNLTSIHFPGLIPWPLKFLFKSPPIEQNFTIF